MNGAMSEAKACQADLPDVDVATFVRFSQWLYAGRYDMPYYGGHSQMCLAMSREEEKVSWDFGLSPKQKRKKELHMKSDGTWDKRITQEMLDEIDTFPKESSTLNHSSRKQSLWEDFMPFPGYALAPPPRKNPEEISVDFTEVLLGHARLYCFADIYGIVPLQKESLNALQAALIDLECQQDQIDVLVRLIEYTMDNTLSVRIHDVPSLRGIVLDFAVIVFEILIENDNFKELLRTNNDLSVELLVLLSKRLG